MLQREDVMRLFCLEIHGLIKLVILYQVFDNVKATDELAVHYELREGRPLVHYFQACDIIR